MPLPETIKIGGFTYRVSLEEANRHWLDEKTLYGRTDPNVGTIFLNPGNRAVQNQETLIHEVLHGILSHTCLDDEWGEKSENYVSRIARGLYAVFIDNPSLLTYWQETTIVVRGFAHKEPPAQKVRQLHIKSRGKENINE